MTIRRSVSALLVFLSFLLVAVVPANAQFGGISKEIAQKAREQLKSLLYIQIGEAIKAGSPLLLDQHSAFPDASASINDFHPKLLTPTDADLSKPLAPGDYVLAVTGYCSQYSIHAPAGGLAYKLARVKGPAAPAISALLVRGTAHNIPPPTLNAEAWRIESGMPLSQWPDEDRSLIHQLIPDYEKDLQGDFLQQLRNTYDQHSSVSIKFLGRRTIPGLPSFDALLAEMGEPGKFVLQLQKSRQILSDKTISAERLPDMLYQPTGDGQPRVLPPSDDPSPSPWAEIQPGIFARLTIIDGNMGRNRFEFRVAPAAIQSVSAPTIAIPHFSNTAFAPVALPGGLSMDTLYATPSLASILEGASPVVARFVIVGGEVVLVAAEGAAAIVSSPVVLTGAGVVLIGYSMYQAAQALGLLPIVMQNQAKPPGGRGDVNTAEDETPGVVAGGNAPVPGKTDSGDKASSPDEISDVIDEVLSDKTSQKGTSKVSEWRGTGGQAGAEKDFQTIIDKTENEGAKTYTKPDGSKTQATTLNDKSHVTVYPESTSGGEPSISITRPGSPKIIKIRYGP